MLPHEENPWTVENLEEFLYFCCPECDERNQSKELFVQHALDQHPNSKDSLIKFQVKKEPIEDNSNADSIQENPAFEMHGNPVYMDYYMSAENDNYDMVKCELKEEFDEDDIPDDEIQPPPAAAIRHHAEAASHRKMHSMDSQFSTIGLYLFSLLACTAWSRKIVLGEK